MPSEVGHGITGFESRDEDTRFVEDLILAPFTGVACAMNWDWQYADEEVLWPHIGVLRNFLQDLKLDEEDWRAGEPSNIILSIDNALTGEEIADADTTAHTGALGKLELAYPGTLIGGSGQPMSFFEMIWEGGTLKKADLIGE